MPLNEQMKDEVKRRIERSAKMQRTFEGPDGTDSLAELKKNFPGGFDKDPYVHAYLAGQYSVIQFIENCIHADTEKARKVLQDAQSKEG